MKKLLFLFLTIVTAAALAVSASALFPERQRLIVNRLSDGCQPIIDGIVNPDEWDTAGRINMTADNCFAWAGEFSCPVNFYFNWDETGLWCAAEVADSDVCLTDSAVLSNVYSMDAFQIALDPGQLIAEGQGGGGMFYSIGPMDNGALGACYHPYGGAAEELTAGFTGAYTKTAAGWSFEMVIPWGSIEILADDGYEWHHAAGSFINAKICYLDRNEGGAVTNAYTISIEGTDAGMDTNDYAHQLVLSENSEHETTSAIYSIYSDRSGTPDTCITRFCECGGTFYIIPETDTDPVVSVVSLYHPDYYTFRQEDDIAAVTLKTDAVGQWSDCFRIETAKGIFYTPLCSFCCLQPGLYFVDTVWEYGYSPYGWGDHNQIMREPNPRKELHLNFSQYYTSVSLAYCDGEQYQLLPDYADLDFSGSNLTDITLMEGQLGFRAQGYGTTSVTYRGDSVSIVIDQPGTDDPALPGGETLPGDLDSDGTVNMYDASLLLQHSIFPGIYPLGYPGNIDFNADGKVNILDTVLLLQYGMYPYKYPLLNRWFSEGLTYASNGDGTCTVTGIGTCTDARLAIPSTSPEGDVVTAVGNGAFSNCWRLTSVTIPKTVTSIGNRAFSLCWNLTSISIPDSVTSIGTEAFSNCTYLSSVNIPDSVTSIGDSAFWYCTFMTSAAIGDSVTSIGNCAFQGCSSLSSVTIPDSIGSIGGNAFRECVKLDTIRYSGTTEQWNAVEKAENWNDIMPDHTIYCADGTISVIGSYSLDANGISYVSNGDGTCYVSGPGTCTDTDIIISDRNRHGDSVTSIGDSAFNYCQSLTTVTIPDNVTYIGENAFRACIKLDTIRYSGTTEQWNAIEKAENWDNSMPKYKVLCSDGDIAVTDRPSQGLLFVIYYNGCSLRGLGSCTDTEIDIPKFSPDGYMVTRIDAYAFYGCTSITSVNIPDSVTSIGNGAFGNCSRLTSVTIPDSVTSIGNDAFFSCGSLKDIFYSGTRAQWSAIKKSNGWDFNTGNYTLHCSDDVPGTASGLVFTSYGNGTCYVSGIGSCTDTEVDIPEFSPRGDKVTGIGGWAFNNCLSLTSITIPDGVTSIGNYAFYGCSALTSITIPDSVTSIGNYAFYDCSSIKSVFISDIETWCHIDFKDFTSNPLIIGTVLYINGEPLTELTIPDSVTHICDYLFYGCNSLTSVTIPDSVTSIGDDAFCYCSSLTSVTIPDSVTSIGDAAFHSCSSLTSVNIPDSVTSIGGRAFYECSSLTSVNIPDGVTNIGDWTFCRWSSLTSVTIPNSVTSIGDFAFADCSSLTSITIPDSVTSIGEWAFYACGSLKDIFYSGTRAQWSAIHKGSGWDSYTGNYTLHCSDDVPGIDNGLVFTSYGNGTCYVSGIGSCTDTEIIIPQVSPDRDKVTGIGDWAFFDCSSLTSVTVPDSVTSIGDYAFSYCSSLTSVTVPDSVTSIGDYAFSYCSSLTSVTIPDSVTSIGNQAFYYCQSLTSVNIPDSVTSIGDYAFCYCSSLTSVTIPDSVTSIGNYAFYGCSALTSITIPDSVTSIGSVVFYNCSALTSVTIPDSVTSISDAAFYGCSSLTSVTIPDSMTSLGLWAFENCTALRDIYYSGTVSQWYSITKMSDWNNNTGSYTVHCTDGDLAK